MIKARKKRVGCPHCDRVFVDHGDVHKHIRGKHGAKKGHAWPEEAFSHWRLPLPPEETK